MIHVPRIGPPWHRSRWALAALSLVFSLLPLRPAVPNVELPSPQGAANVVAWWRFQNGAKGAAAAPDHLIEDASGNDQHGVAVGRPRFRRVALPASNLALEFTSDEQRVFVLDDEAFQLTGSLTIEAYVEVQSCPSFASQIVFRGDERGGFDPWFLRLTDSGRLQFVVTNDRNEASCVESPTPLPLRTWLHVAGTLDDATGEQRLYSNGVVVATRTTRVRAAGVLGGTQPGIGIGNLQNGGNQGFRGAIDEVRISAAALAPCELLPPSRSTGRATEASSHVAAGGGRGMSTRSIRRSRAGTCRSPRRTRWSSSSTERRVRSAPSCGSCCCSAIEHARLRRATGRFTQVRPRRRAPKGRARRTIRVSRGAPFV